ncbi:hypothetical protein RF55_4773 [Lasius niger]|uniref:Uncharacterized protein n=1 Tax=Lasius niger TaxID=67767 RepID=A0A0J7NRF6_LASNI|nr:hypothetical protein RF55_4773 [Lasius niger]
MRIRQLTKDRCPQISGLHAVVVCLLLGAVVLVVGLVQLAPGATTTNHRLALLVAGAALLILGVIIAGVRCYMLHCVPLPVESPVATPIPPVATTEQAPPAVPKDTLDLLVGHQNQPETDALMQHREHHHHHHQHYNYHHHNNHKKKRSSQGSQSEEA